MARVKASRQHRMVVVRHRPFLTWGLRIGTVLFSGLGIAAAYYYGLYKGSHDHLLLVNEVATQQSTIEELKAAKKGLQQELINIKTGLDIDKQANESVRQKLMENKYTLENALAENEMYRNILNPDTTHEKGPSLDKWSLSATNTANQYSFKITAKQLVNPNGSIKGLVTLKIAGELNGTTKTLDYADIALGSDKKLPVNFKYFQTVAGTFELPTDFAPREITLTLQLAGKKKDTITQTYAWSI